ncbi:MAG: MutS-related protein [bacterium]
MKFLDEQTGNSIGFNQIWSEINTHSPLGQSIKSNSTPFLSNNSDELEVELNNLDIIIEQIKNNKKLFSNIESILRGLKDIRRTITITRNKKTILDDIELFEVKENLIKIGKIRTILENIHLENFFKEELYNLTDLLKYLSIGQGTSNSFYLSNEYDPLLADIRSERKKLENQLLEYKRKLSSDLEKLAKRPLSIDGEITVDKNDSDLIELFKESNLLTLIRENFASLTFKLIENEKIVNYKNEISKIKAKEEKQKQLIRKKVTDKIAEYSLKILSNLNNIAYLDFMIAKARFSIKINGVRPEISEDDKIEIQSGRHLLVEEELKNRGMEFQAVDIKVKRGSTLITGPNMGGKTVNLKMIALLIAMSQYGLFVPAKRMVFKPRNYIYFSLTTDNIKSGLSKFGSEIVALKDIINLADQKALILIDEIAHGTNPREGYAIAHSIIKKLDEKNSISVITTHFERLASTLDLKHLQVRGLNQSLLQKYTKSIKNDRIDILNKCMDYSLENVSSETKIPYDAIKVAKVLGFDQEILNNAENIIKNDLGLNGGDF